MRGRRIRYGQPRPHPARARDECEPLLEMAQFGSGRDRVAEKTSSYVHGTAPEEQRRLSRLNELTNEASLRELALTGGERILDLGCGLGQLTRAMARAAGPGAFTVGVEQSTAQLQQAEQQARVASEEHLVDFRQGDVLDLKLMEHEWGSFDVAHARFVLEHVADPAAVVRSMARALRPGGRAILEDDDHAILRLWPEPAGAQSMWDAYLRTYQDVGNDPFVGRRLVELLQGARLQPKRNTWLFFGACSGSPLFPLYVENLIEIFRGAREQILFHLQPPVSHERYQVSVRRFDEAIESLREWGQRSDAAFGYAIAWAEGVKPSASPGAPARTGLR